MRILIVDDEFCARKLLVKILSEYGDCNVAVNGKEAVEACCIALEEGAPYKLICLDIMMPEMDGQQVLKEIRSLEADNGIFGHQGAKIIMTTALDDSLNFLMAFKEQCEAYIVKPIMKAKLLEKLLELNLIKNAGLQA